MTTARNALLSVSDKTNLVPLAQTLSAQGIRLFSTGGTADALRAAGIDVVNIADITHFPEIMNGRVKTLHPRIFGGILARQDAPSHLEDAEKHEIPLFHFVIVNLYPFVETVRSGTATLDEAIENIDIGGVTLIRAAAKNYHHVAIVTEPDQYAGIIDELEKNDGVLSLETRKMLSVRAFRQTANYDREIHDYFSRQQGEPDLRESLTIPLEKITDLRYGENPHQKAALYQQKNRPVSGVVGARQLQGKELSYNNIMDADSTFHLANSFVEPAISIIKHANPCGVAVGPRLVDAYKAALATDSVSAFGGIVGANVEVDKATAEGITSLFTEVVIAPGFSKEALDVFSAKKNLRVLQAMPAKEGQQVEMLEMRPVSGGILIQDKDLRPDDDTKFEVVSKRQPTDDEWSSMLFAWKVVRWVKSNAVIYVKGQATVGVGAGQMSRVDSSRIAAEKAKIAGLDLEGSVVASDAFFPFADGVTEAAKVGASAVIQPGGSIRDQEVIDEVNLHNMVMVFTKCRHFRH